MVTRQNNINIFKLFFGKDKYIDKPVVRLHKEKRNTNKIINEWTDCCLD